MKTRNGIPSERSRVISVLIVNHDGLATIERAIESVGAGRDPAVEVIVADNASSDGSLQRVQERFPAVLTLEMGANLGFGTANNRAAARASGQFLLLLNDDAWLKEGALESLRERMLADDRVAAVAPRLEGPAGEQQFVWVPGAGFVAEALQTLRNRFEGSRLAHQFVQRVGHGCFGAGWFSAACLLLRREAFEAVGGFDEAFFLYFEDTDLCLRLKQAGYTLAYASRARAVHARSPAPAGGPIEIAYRQSQVHFYAKHRPAWEQRLLRAHLSRKYSASLRPDAVRLRELLGLQRE